LTLWQAHGQKIFDARRPIRLFGTFARANESLAPSSLVAFFYSIFDFSLGCFSILNRAEEVDLKLELDLLQHIYHLLLHFSF
jgi:hypothetical protein